MNMMEDMETYVEYNLYYEYTDDGNSCRWHITTDDGTYLEGIAGDGVFECYTDKEDFEYVNEHEYDGLISAIETFFLEHSDSWE